MMVFTAIDPAIYEEAAIQITYCKLFPLILEDYLTREDAKKMMESTNLSVSTTVNTMLSGTAGPAPLSGTGAGTGSGQVQAAYKGETALAGSQALANEKKVIKEGGGTATKVAIGG